MWESGCWGVGLFLFLSGYGIHESYKKSGLCDYWTKRLSKIYLPYIIVMASEILIDTFFFGKKYSEVSVLKVFLGGERIDGTMWYIFYLILFYAAFWIIYKVRKEDSYFNIGCLFLYGILLAILWMIGIYDTPVLSGVYFPFFAGGCLISKWSDDSECYRKICGTLSTHWMLRVVLYVTLTGVVLLLLFIGQQKGEIGILSAVSSTYFFVLMVVIWAVLEQKDIGNYVLSIIGRNSYYLYLLEGVFLTKYIFSFNIVDNRYVSIGIYFFVLCFSAYILKRGVMIIEKTILPKREKKTNDRQKQRS